MNKTITQKDTRTPVLTATGFTITKKQPKCPSTDKWKADMVHTQWNTTQPQQKNKAVPSAATRMQLEGIILSEVSQKRQIT